MCGSLENNGEQQLAKICLIVEGLKFPCFFESLGFRRVLSVIKRKRTKWAHSGQNYTRCRLCDIPKGLVSKGVAS
jgi:hypothetical protein